MNYINEQIAGLIREKECEAWFSERKLANGICTHGALSKIKNGSSIRDPRFLTILLQRLGKSANKLELIVSKKSLEIVEMQTSFEQYIDESQSEEAERLLKEYKKIAENRNSTSIDKMYYWRNIAIYKHYCENDFKGAEKAIIKAISITIPKWHEKGLEKCIVSTTEIENVLELFYLNLILSDHASLDCDYEGIMHEIEKVEDYVEIHITDDEEKATILPKIKWVKAKTLERLGKKREAVRCCEVALDYLKRYGFLNMLPGVLEILVKYGRNGLGGYDYKEIIGYSQAIDYILSEEKMAAYKWNSLLFRSNRTLYHSDSAFISGQRHSASLSQEKIAEAVNMSAESISRIETGKTSPNDISYITITSALGVDLDKHNGIIQTTDYAILEKYWSVCVEGYVDNYEHAESILHQLKKELDVKCIKNKAMIKFLEEAIAIHYEKCDFERAIEESREILRQTFRYKNNKIYRTPLLYEFYLMLEIAVCCSKLNKTEEALQIYKLIADICEKDEVDVVLRQRIYSMALYRNAYLSRDYRLLQRVRKYELKTRSIHLLGKTLCAQSCLTINKNREQGKKMMRHSYYLALLSNSYNYAENVRKLMDNYC